MKRCCVMLVLSLLTGAASKAVAQSVSFTVKGVVADTVSRQGLDAANVALLREKDSSLLMGTMTERDGRFTLDKVAAGRYLLTVSYLGYQTLMKPLRLTGQGRELSLGLIVLNRQNMEIGEVAITAKFNPIIVKKDTVEFNTSAYKIQESDVVEDLLKKLPGVEVESDGSVTSGGEQITKVFVEGKQFFGTDPKVALKNLPANMIDKVQVVDRKSDQAQFTGIEDDNTEKVINLTLRPGNRNGTFGRATLGYGTDRRYNGAGILSYFQGETQLAALLSRNNANNIGFSDFMGDVMTTLGGGGGGRGGGGRGGGGGGFNLGGFSINSGSGGLNTTTAGGANANLRLNKKMTLNGSYFVNLVDSRVERTTDREEFVGDSSIFRRQLTTRDRKSQGHSLNFELNYTIDSLNSLLFRPSLQVGKGTSDGISDYRTLSAAGDSINSGVTRQSSDNSSFSTSGSLLWRHRFRKAGRTFSLNLSYGISKNEADGGNIQRNKTYRNGVIDNDSSVNQTYTNNSNSYNFGVRASYTEPFARNHFLELSYSYSQRNTSSEKITHNAGSTAIDTALSTDYENIYINQQYDVRFNSRQEKYSYTFGLGLQPSSIVSIDGFEDDRRMTQNVLNFSPTANFTYGVTRQNQLRLDYRGTTQQPSLEQLQPAKDNTDPLYQYLGNPELKPSFRHRLRVTYNRFNPDNMRTFLTSLTYTQTGNSIVNASVYDANRKQTVRPVNVNGIYSLNARVMVNMPIAQSKFSFNNTLSGSYGNNVSYSASSDTNHDGVIDFDDGIRNLTRTAQVGETFRLVFRNDWLELTGSYHLSYNHADYSTAKTATTNYFNHVVGGDLYLSLPWDFVVTSTVDYRFYRGYDDNSNRDMVMWNADLSKKIFKSKRGTLKLSVSDILKQKKNYSRTTTDNYIQDVATNTIGSFVMLSFSYRFSTFGSKAENRREREQFGRERMFRGEGGPPQR